MSLRKLAFLVMVVIAVIIGLMASGGLRTTHAQVALPPEPCADIEGQEVCIFLDPGFSENDAGAEHTVTAFVSADFEPDVGEKVAFDVTSGPNFDTAGTCSPNADCTTDANGQALSPTPAPAARDGTSSRPA